MNKEIYKPTIFNLEAESERRNFIDFKEKNTDVYFIDNLGEQKHELNLVENSKLISHTILNTNIKSSTNDNDGVWVYFPWKRTAVKILNKDKYSKLRLSRNHNLINQDEENILKKATISIAGLNVGNPGAVCLVLEGIGYNIKLADFDILSVSNLNRFRAGLPDIELNKAIISARQMYEINPFLNIEVYDKGIDNDNMEHFLNFPKVDILIEETDNLKLKINIREIAKKNKIPVLMVTGNGENVLVDVERYDYEYNIPLLSGFLSDSTINKIKAVETGRGTYEERINLAMDFMDKKYLDPRLVESFMQVGNTLAGIPQLAESSFLRGAVICHFTKHILLKHEIPSGRYSVSMSGVKIIS